MEVWSCAAGVAMEAERVIDGGELKAGRRKGIILQKEGSLKWAGCFAIPTPLICLRYPRNIHGDLCMADSAP